MSPAFLFIASTLVASTSAAVTTLCDPDMATSHRHDAERPRPPTLQVIRPRTTDQPTAR